MTLTDKNLHLQPSLSSILLILIILLELVIYQEIALVHYTEYIILNGQVAPWQGDCVPSMRDKPRDQHLSKVEETQVRRQLGHPF